MADSASSTDWVTIGSGVISAEINPLGAELSSLQDDAGRELMTDADPAFWTGRAPLLFPIVGQLRDDHYRLGHETHRMEKHGFARRQNFDLIAQSANTATFKLPDNAETRAQYPFAFALTMAFAIVEDRLSMTATIANQGDQEMPFSFGFHPAFAWPLPYGGAVEDHRIIFEKPEPAPIRRIGIEPGLIEPTHHDTPVEGSTFAPTFVDFDNDAIIWDELQSRSLTWGVPGQPSLEITFPDTPMLGLWQIPGARYLCIEPWAGRADPVGYAGDFTDKPGVMLLDAGAERAFRMDVRLKES